jgi:hypothetical protein
MTRKRTSDNDLVVSATGAASPARRKSAARPRGNRAAEPVAALAPAVIEPEAVTPQADAGDPVFTPSFDTVAKLAYSYWEARGFQGGSPEEDWLRAERELRDRTAVASA